MSHAISSSTTPLSTTKTDCCGGGGGGFRLGSLPQRRISRNKHLKRSLEKMNRMRHVFVFDT